MKTTEISCPCGAVRVQLTGDPVTEFYCHCNDCQITSGGAYTGVAIYPSEAVKVMQGDLQTWTLETLPRQRCTICGTHVMAEVSQLGHCGIKANLLPKGAFKPDFHLYCQHAVLPIKDDLPHYKDLPARFGGTDEAVDW